MPRRSLKETPPLGLVLEETRTTRTVPASKSVDALLKQAFAHKDEMAIAEFVRIAWGIDEVTGLAVKKSAPGAGGMFSGVLETIAKGDKAPDEIEVYLHQTFRPGRFVLSPMVNGFFVQPKTVNIGTLEELESAGYTAPTASAQVALRSDPMVEIKRKLAELIDLKTAKDFLEGDAMKPGDIAALASAFRPSTDGAGETMKVVMQLLIAQQERSDKLMAILVEKLGQPAAATSPSVIEKLIDVVVKKLTPETLGGLLSGRRGTEDENAWKPSDVLTIVQAAGPVLGQVMSAIGSAVRVVPPATEQPALTDGQPAAPTGGPVQYDLDSDEKDSLDQILTWIKDKDYRSAWAMLQASAPRLCMLAINLDPEAKAEAYLPFLKACSLKCRQPETQADLLEWLRWCQAEKQKAMAAAGEEET